MSAPVVRLNNIEKRFGARKALDNISFEVADQEHLVLFGPNGAGKTTLLRVIATLTKPTKGTVEIMGRSTADDIDEFRSQIGIISHQPMLYPDLSALENLTLFGDLYGVTHTQERALELLDMVELSHRRHEHVRAFSKGMTQRVAIARAFMHQPALVLLDEPYSGLDPHASKILDDLLECMQHQCTYISVSHDILKDFEHATQAMVIDQGKIVFHMADIDHSSPASRTLFVQEYERVGEGSCRR